MEARQICRGNRKCATSSTKICMTTAPSWRQFSLPFYSRNYTLHWIQQVYEVVDGLEVYAGVLFISLLPRKTRTLTLYRDLPGHYVNYLILLRKLKPMKDLMFWKISFNTQVFILCSCRAQMAMELVETVELIILWNGSILEQHYNPGTTYSYPTNLSLT